MTVRSWPGHSFTWPLASSYKKLKISILDININLKITHSRLQLHLPVSWMKLKKIVFQKDRQKELLWDFIVMLPLTPLRPGMGVYQAKNFLCSFISLVFQNYQNIGYLLNITFTFDRTGVAAMTPVKYECDHFHKVKNFPGRNQWRELQ